LRLLWQTIAGSDAPGFHKRSNYGQTAMLSEKEEMVDKTLMDEIRELVTIRFT